VKGDFRGLREGELIVTPTSRTPRIHPDRCDEASCTKRGCACRTHSPAEMTAIMFGAGYERSW
jgi:hypothetical protein